MSHFMPGGSGPGLGRSGSGTAAPDWNTAASIACDGNHSRAYGLAREVDSRHAPALIPRSGTHGRRSRLQPLDGAAGRAVRAPVYRAGVRLQRVQPADDEAHRHHRFGAGRLEAHRPRLDLHARDLLPRGVRGRVRPVGGGGRPAPRDVHRGAVLRRRLPGLGRSASMLHKIWIVYLGYGVLGGIGLGIGYISPVSTLIKWFPDRPGMATGMAIMGFGGGALIASPLVGLADGQLLDADACRRRRDLHRARDRLFRLHDGRRVRSCGSPRRAGSLPAGRAPAQPPQAGDDAPTCTSIRR